MRGSNESAGKGGGHAERGHVPLENAPGPIIPEIVAEGVCKSFGTRAVLAGVDLEVLRGQMVGIVGGSGSGKTVLLHMLAGLLAPSAGRVLVADHSHAGTPLVDLSQLDESGLDAVRRHWAVVFQRNALFSGSVYQNIRLLLSEHRSMPEQAMREKAREALRAVALDVDDVIDRDRDSLSGGMAKRVAIARALAIDPAVIFYDEPTTGLDPVVAAHIHDLIWTTHHRPLGSGTDAVARTSILVTHDKELLRRVGPFVVMLHDGGVCFAGAYADFTRVKSGPPRDYLRAMPVLHARPGSP